MPARPSECEQALLRAGVAARLVAALPAQEEGADTAAALTEALRAGWWSAGRDAMHGVGPPRDETRQG